MLNARQMVAAVELSVMLSNQIILTIPEISMPPSSLGLHKSRQGGHALLPRKYDCTSYEDIIHYRTKKRYYPLCDDANSISPKTPHPVIEKLSLLDREDACLALLVPAKALFRFFTQ